MAGGGWGEAGGGVGGAKGGLYILDVVCVMRCGVAVFAVVFLMFVYLLS